jgi:hypothetical protein
MFRGSSHMWGKSYNRLILLIPILSLRCAFYSYNFPLAHTNLNFTETRFHFNLINYDLKQVYTSNYLVRIRNLKSILIGISGTAHVLNSRTVSVRVKHLSGRRF